MMFNYVVEKDITVLFYNEKMMVKLNAVCIFITTDYLALCTNGLS